MHFVVRFGFLLSGLVFPAPMYAFAFSCSSIAFCCYSLLFVARCCSLWFSLLLMSTTPFIDPKLKQMNENGNEKCSVLLFVARFGF